MTHPSQVSTDLLVEELAARVRRIDLVGWARIAAWAEELALSFEDLRLLLALRMTDGARAVSELADLAGLSLKTAYPAMHRLRDRGYVREERRRYALSEEGQGLVARLDEAHREGIRAYVDDLDPGERERLVEALVVNRD